MIDIILNLIKQHQISDYALEKALGFTQGTISNWRRGKNKVSTEAIVKLARYFGVSTDFILGLSEDNSQKNFNVSDSQVAIGNEVNGSNNTINGNNNCNTSLSDTESELLQIFRDCSEGQKLMLLGYAKTLMENK